MTDPIGRRGLTRHCENQLLPGNGPKKSPARTIELHLTNATEDLSRQDADIAVRTVRPTQAALVARKVGVVGVGLFAHQTYLAAHRTPRSLDDTSGLALIGPDREVHYLDWLRDRGLNIAAKDLAIRTDNQIAQLAAIRADSE